MPHAPQFISSILVSTHIMSHIMPTGQVQDESRQTSPPGHAASHAPQLAASRMVFTHNPEQSIVGSVHAHSPSTQTFPPLHASPHPPQLALSVCVSTQLAAHSVVAAGQLSMHADAPHTSSVSHVVIHSPQLSGSSVRSKQTPAQSVVPFVHSHRPLTHCLPPPHVMPQPPQFASSLRVLAH